MIPHPVWHWLQTVAVGQTVSVVGWTVILAQPHANVTAADDTEKPVSLRSCAHGQANMACLPNDLESGDTYRQQSRSRRLCTSWRSLSWPSLLLLAGTCTTLPVWSGSRSVWWDMLPQSVEQQPRLGWLTRRCYFY